MTDDDGKNLPPAAGEWVEWRQYVLTELFRHERDIRSATHAVNGLRQDSMLFREELRIDLLNLQSETRAALQRLESRSAIWSAFGAATPVIVALVLAYVFDVPMPGNP